MSGPQVFPINPELSGIVDFVLYQKSNVPTQPFLSPSWSRTALIISIQNNVLVDDKVKESISTPPKISLKGINTYPTFVNFENDFIEYIGADLTPEAIYVLTGSEGSEFVNEYRDANLFWDTTKMLADIEEVNSPEAKKEVFEQFILSKVDQGRLAEVDLFRKAIQTIKESNFAITLPELYDELAVSKMTINRLFKKIVGIPPKTFLSLLLFEQMMKTKKDERQSLEEIATHSFYDLSHINKWFQKYVACSPTEFMDVNMDMNEKLLLKKKK